MRLKPFARFFGESIYRTDYFVICSREQDFIPTLKKIIKTDTNLGKGGLDIVNHVAKSSNEECNGRTWRLTHRTSKRKVNAIIVIWMRPGVDVSIVTHEAWHAAFWIFQDRGMHLDAGHSPTYNGADEPMAYYLQWLVRSMLGLHKGGDA